MIATTRLDSRQRLRRFLTGPCLVAGMMVLTLCGAFPAMAGEDHVLIVGGLGGEEKYQKDFLRTVTTLRSLLVEMHQYDAARVHVLAEDAADPAVEASSTVENLKAAFGAVSEQAGPEDTVLLIAVGHGQSDFQEAKLNLPGPDLTPRELAGMLDALPTRNQRLILLFPCSGQFSETLAAAGRVVLASTDGPRQVYGSAAPRYLLQALSEGAADIDLDGTIDFRELFESLSEEVEGHYKALNAIQLENPSLEDNGDGRVTTLVEGMDAGDGELAESLRFVPAPGKG